MDHARHLDQIFQDMGRHMKRTTTDDRRLAGIRNDDIHRSTGKTAESNLPGGLNSVPLSNNGIAAAVFSRPASPAGGQASGDGSTQSTYDRRDCWLDRGQFPSFEFTIIDDEQVLKLEAAQRGASEAVTGAPRLRDNESRRLAGFAADMQRMIEGDIASLLKELAGMPAAKHPAASKAADARTSFSLFIQHVQAAKLAAADGRQAQMTSELTLALGKLDSFTESHAGSNAGKRLAFKAPAAAIRSTLARLASACRTWAGITDTLDTLSTASDVDASGGSSFGEGEARLRSVSSPEPITARPAENDPPRPTLAGSSSPGKKPSDRNPAKGKEKPGSPGLAAGRKLKALFSRSSEPRARKADDGDADTNPRSPRGRSVSEAGAASAASTSSLPDLVGLYRDNPTSGTLKSPRRAENNSPSDS
jgi:hypothetical protein